MSWTLYAIGDAAFLTQVLQAVARISGSGSLIAAARTGLLLGVLLVFMQSVLSGGRQLNLQQVLVAWLLFALMFSTHTTVVVEDAYTGDARTVSGVPTGVAVTGAIISTLGYTLTAQFEQAFSTPAMSHNGFASSLDTLVAIRQELFDGSNTLTGSSDNAALEQSWQNYIKECTLVGLDIGQLSLHAVQANPDVLQALAFSSSVYGTEIYLDGKTLQPTCSAAHAMLVHATTSQLLPAVSRTLATLLDVETHTDINPDLRGALNHLGLSTVTTQQYLATSVLLPLYQRAVEEKQLDELSFTTALMVHDALERRHTRWAAEQTLFMRIVRPMMTFFEGFIMAVTPVMAFVITLGQAGIQMVGKYLLVLVWIQLWMPVLAIINLYIHLAASAKLSALSQYDQVALTSLAGLDRFDSVLQTWLSTGGMLAASVPAISLMLVYGSAVAATHLAGRLQAGDVLNEQIATPAIANTAPLMQTEARYQTSQLSGASVSGTDHMLTHFALDDTVSTVMSQASEQLNQTSQRFSRSLSEGMQSSLGQSTSRATFSSLGRQVASSQSQSSQVVNAATDALQQQFRFADTQKDAVRGMVAGVLSGGVNLSGQRNATDRQTVDAQDSLFARLLTSDSQDERTAVLTDSMNVGASGNGGIQGQAAHSDERGREQSVQDTLSKAQSLITAGERRSQFNEALVSDLRQQQQTGFESSLSESRQAQLQHSADNVSQASDRVGRLQQSAQSLSASRTMDGATLTNMAARNPAAMQFLSRYMGQHAEAAARMRELLPRYQSLLPDDKQAFVVASLESLTHSTASTAAERDNDHQAALTLLQLTTGHHAPDTLPSTHEQKTDLNQATPFSSSSDEQLPPLQHANAIFGESPMLHAHPLSPKHLSQGLAVQPLRSDGTDGAGSARQSLWSASVSDKELDTPLSAVLPTSWVAEPTDMPIVDNETSHSFADVLTTPQPGRQAIEAFYQQGNEAVQQQLTQQQQLLGQQGEAFWYERIMQHQPSVSTAARLFALPDTVSQRTDQALADLNQWVGESADQLEHYVRHPSTLSEQLGRSWDDFTHQMQQSQAPDGMLHDIALTSQASWAGLKAAADAGASLENPLTAFTQQYEAHRDEQDTEPDWGSRTAAVLAGIEGAADEGLAHNFVSEYQQTFYQAAYHEAQQMGLTPLQSELFATAFTDGLSDWTINTEGNTGSEAIEGIRERMLRDYSATAEAESPTDEAFVDQQIAIITSAALSGEYARSNLIDIRGYNAARQLRQAPENVSE